MKGDKIQMSHMHVGKECVSKHHRGIKPIRAHRQHHTSPILSQILCTHRDVTSRASLCLMSCIITREHLDCLTKLT